MEKRELNITEKDLLSLLLKTNVSFNTLSKKYNIDKETLYNFTCSKYIFRQEYVDAKRSFEYFNYKYNITEEKVNFYYKKLVHDFNTFGKELSNQLCKAYFINKKIGRCNSLNKIRLRIIAREILKEHDARLLGDILCSMQTFKPAFDSFTKESYGSDKYEDYLVKYIMNSKYKFTSYEDHNNERILENFNEDTIRHQVKIYIYLLDKKEVR